MKQLRYHIATISFNPDLVDPEAKGCPVGLLFVGETGTDAVALLALGHRPRFADRLPTVMRSILDDFPALMVAQLDEMLKDQGSTSIDGIMEAFEDSLRNSFFVSDLKMNQYVDVPLETPDPAPEQALYALEEVRRRLPELAPEAGAEAVRAPRGR